MIHRNKQKIPVQIPRVAITDYYLSPIAFRLLCYIHSLSNDDDFDETFAERLANGVENYKLAMEQLDFRGYLKWERHQSIKDSIEVLIY